MRVRRHEQQRDIFHRSPQATIASNPSDVTMVPTTASDSIPVTTSVVSKIPKSTAALASVMTLFGVTLLAALRRKVPLHRSSFTDEKHVDLENVSIYMEQPEKPKQAFLIHTSSSRDTNAGWTPQVKFQPIRRQSQCEVKTSQPVTPPSSTAASIRSPVLSVRNIDEPSSAEPVVKKKTRSLHKPPSMKLGSLDSGESRNVSSPPPAYGIPNRIILETEDGTPTSAAPLYLYPGNGGLGTGTSRSSPGWYTSASGPSTPLSNITVTTTTTVETDGDVPPPPLPSPVRSESFNIPHTICHD
ncbi:hypothetical protein BDQ17DRAFT_444930 [Cyathus striatus]|nr:hypothetical protein BDQ17DRAFT_444930 [Cyathus striatus]